MNMRTGKRCIVTALALWLVALAAVAQGGLLVTGVVKDRNTRQELGNVNIAVPGTNIGTVSNADGVFSLKASADDLSRGIVVSHLGYRSASVAADVLTAPSDKRLTVWLEPSPLRLDEISIFGGNPVELVEAAVARIAPNYAPDAHLFSAFYRETIRKGRRYIGVSEAVADVYKTAYRQRDLSRDRVQIQKGRRLESQKRSDTLAVKIMGGPHIANYLDVAKNADDLLSPDLLHCYRYEMLLPASIDGRMHFAVGFVPKVKLEFALYRGVLYIDQQTLTISRAEYELDMTDRDKAIRYMLRKKPAGVRFKPQSMTFLANYRRVGDRSYLHYVRNEIRFKCDWRKRLFSSTFTTVTEMVMVDRTDRPDSRIHRRDAFGRTDIFYDVVLDYWNEDFWRDYNIIEPTESLESAVKRLKKQLR